VESDDPYFTDRFFFTCHNAEGTLELMAGLGTYPNVNVIRIQFIPGVRAYTKMEMLLKDAVGE